MSLCLHSYLHSQSPLPHPSSRIRPCLLTHHPQLAYACSPFLHNRSLLANPTSTISPHLVTHPQQSVFACSTILHSQSALLHPSSTTSLRLFTHPLQSVSAWSTLSSKPQSACSYSPILQNPNSKIALFAPKFSLRFIIKECLINHNTWPRPLTSHLEPMLPTTGFAFS